MIDEKSWYDYIGIHFSSPKITVYLPKSEYTSLLIHEDTGDVEIPKNFTFKDVDISLNSVIATEKFFIERSTGDVILEGSDAAEIFIETDTGDVSGTLLSDKFFTTETDTGRVDVPKTITGGKCEISTDTGDIKIDVIP